MAYEHLWSSHFVKLSIPIYGKITTFDCDYRIAEVIEALNKKGYYTGNCCEGHPYKKPNSKGDTVAYFDGGYICFCDVKDAEYFLSKLNEKCDNNQSGFLQMASLTTKALVQAHCKL